jgi:hypothetical protein
MGRKLKAFDFPESKGTRGALDKTFETCRKHGIDFDGRQERAFYVRLETKWKEEVQSEKAKQEQASVEQKQAKQENKTETANDSPNIDIGNLTII